MLNLQFIHFVQNEMEFYLKVTKVRILRTIEKHVIINFLDIVFIENV